MEYESRHLALDRELVAVEGREPKLASTNIALPSLAIESSTVARWTWLALLFFATTALTLAVIVHPDAAGHGTHTQLGLPPCGFLLWTGLPCPSCGLTTSFAHFVRLELAAGVTANPVGAPLFLATVVTIPWSAVAAWQALPIHKMNWLPLARGVLVLLAAWILDWIVKLTVVWT